MARQHDGAAERAGARIVRPCADIAGLLVSSALLSGLIGSVLLLKSLLILTGQMRPPQHNLLVSVRVPVLAGVLCLWITIWCFKVTRRRARLDQKRQVAACGDRTWVHLAAEQPAAEAPLPTEPLMVGVRMRRPAVVALWCIVCLIGAYLALTALAGYLPLSSALVALVSFGSFTGGIPRVGLPGWFAYTGVILGYVLGARALRSGQQIEATASGLKLRMGGAHTISWQDARLFAIYRGDPRRTPRWYDVSSAQTVLHWVWLRPGTLLALLFEPTVPFEEYDRQMERFLSLIAARTGLPLYDLR